MNDKGHIDLLLINPGGSKEVYQKLSNELSAIEPPVWAGLIATYIRLKGFSVKILDANAEKLNPKETARRVIETKAVLTAVVVYGHNPLASTMVMPATRELCNEIKKESKNKKILLVGGHVAALPEYTILSENVDFVCEGEGPVTTFELLKALKSEKADYTLVHGLWYRHGKDLISTKPAPNVQNLDEEMPGIAWDLLPMELYRAHNWHCFEHINDRKPYAAIYTTLGCPFKCSFCCIQAPFKSGEKVQGINQNRNSYRRWSPQSIVNQIDLLTKKYGIKNIKFADELFVLNKKHVQEICDLLIDGNYDLNIWAYARVDTINVKMVRKMKEAGIKWLCLGIESGSLKVRNEVKKGYKQKDLAKAIRILKDYKIHIIANYLFGLPEENLESMQKTLELAMKLKTEFANFYCAMAYPGSKLYDHALKKKMILPNSWSGYSQHAYDTLPLPTKHIVGVDVLRFRDKAFKKYFNNPGYLKMVNEKFGYKVVEHIKKMSAVPLERKYC